MHFEHQFIAPILNFFASVGQLINFELAFEGDIFNNEATESVIVTPIISLMLLSRYCIGLAIAAWILVLLFISIKPTGWWHERNYPMKREVYTQARTAQALTVQTSSPPNRYPTRIKASAFSRTHSIFVLYFTINGCDLVSFLSIFWPDINPDPHSCCTIYL